MNSSQMSKFNLMHLKNKQIKQTKIQFENFLKFYNVLMCSFYVLLTNPTQFLLRTVRENGAQTNHHSTNTIFYANKN